MPGNRLENIKVAMLVTDGFEQIELTSPKEALESQGAVVHILVPAERPEFHMVQGANHGRMDRKFEVDSTIEEANPDDYDAVLLPGGVMNADKLRVNESAKDFVRIADEQGETVASICHGPWLMVSAGIVRGRQMTSYHTIKDDLTNAGARWVDQSVVVDANFISSRHPGDLPEFNQALIEELSQLEHAGVHGESGIA